MYLRLLSLLTLVFVFAGCQTLPPERVEEYPVEAPPTWASADERFTQIDYNRGWLEDINDPMLASLVDEAIANNYSLQAAAARLERSYAIAEISGANRWPSVSAGFRAARNQRNNAQGLRVVSNLNNTFTPTIDVSWELDLWGRVKNGHQAAIADWQAAQEVYRAARLSLATRVARSWVNVIEAKLQLELTEKTLESFENNQRIIEDQFKKGLARALEFQLIKSNVASTRANYERRKRLYDAAVRSFQIILGRYPDAELQVASSLPGIVAEVPVGLPSELLERRADIIESERRLAATSVRIDESKKSLLPAIRLTGSTGTASSQFEEIINSDFKIWNIAANITQPIFQGKRLSAGVKRAEANYNEAIANFGNTLLMAFSEVESALAAEKFYEVENQAQTISAQESAEAAEMAWEEYFKGLTEISTALESQRRAFNAESSKLQTNAQRIQTRLDLYLALGGDFKTVTENDSI